MSTAIVQHDPVILKLIQAGTALTEAKTIQQTKLILDVAAAAEIYAKRQKLGDDAEGIAHSIKIDALRQLGEMLKDAPKAKARFHEGNKKEPSSNDAPTLAELGLDKKTSAVAQKLADLPEKDFEQVRDGHETVAKAIAAVSQTKPKKPAPTTVPEPVPASPKPDYTETDALHDQVADLQDALSVAHMKESTDEEKAMHADLVASLRAELKTARAMVEAITRSRDQLMVENNQLKRQCQMYRKKLNSLEARKHGDA